MTDRQPVSYVMNLIFYSELSTHVPAPAIAYIGIQVRIVLLSMTNRRKKYGREMWNKSWSEQSAAPADSP